MNILLSSLCLTSLRASPFSIFSESPWFYGNFTWQAKGIKINFQIYLAMWMLFVLLHSLPGEVGEWLKPTVC